METKTAIEIAEVIEERRQKLLEEISLLKEVAQILKGKAPTRKAS